MKCYKDSTGHLHRTQAEAKASGHPFETEIVPNDQQGLIDYMNQIRPEQPVVLSDDEGVTDSRFTPTPQADGRGDDPAPPYENGHPTTPFMGSRDPRAVFTCTHCGKANANG